MRLIFSVLWSVAIEEQFYLLWSVLLTIVPVKYYNASFLGIIIFILYSDSIMLGMSSSSIYTLFPVFLI